MVQNVMNDESMKKVGKNHVPTCPIIAGPVTYKDCFLPVGSLIGMLV